MVREQLDERLFRTTAPNGLNVLTEHLPGLRSAAVGVWVRWASGHEGLEQMGVAHLLEHMVFKGTERRTAKELARALEVRGARSTRTPAETTPATKPMCWMKTSRSRLISSPI